MDVDRAAVDGHRCIRTGALGDNDVVGILSVGAGVYVDRGCSALAPLGVAASHRDRRI